MYDLLIHVVHAIILLLRQPASLLYSSVPVYNHPLDQAKCLATRQNELATGIYLGLGEIKSKAETIFR